MTGTIIEVDDELFATAGSVKPIGSAPRGGKSMATAVTNPPTDGAVEKEPPVPATDSIIAYEMTVTGTVRSQGDAKIDGQVLGDVIGTVVTIGENGLVRGDVLAEQIYVRGRVKGVLCATKVALGSESHVCGNIYHQLLQIEAGARFEGQSLYSEEPKNLAQASRDAREQGAPAPSADRDGAVRRKRRAA